MNLRFIEVDTQDGPFGVLADERTVVAAGWLASPAALASTCRLDVRDDIERVEADAAVGVLALARDAVLDYYAGDLGAPRHVPVRAPSAAFHAAAHRALRAIEPGEVLAYAALAERAGRPRAIRAAAAACAANRTALFTPCHRAIRSDGALGGFLYGVDVKRSLLAREGAGDAAREAQGAAIPRP